MDIIHPKIQEYISRHTSKEDELLKELSRETHLKMLMPNMICGHEQGLLLEMISRARKPKYILELGTFTGYSAICLAKGLCDEGKLITIEADEEKKELIEKYIEQSGMSHKIELKIGNAQEIIPDLTYNFDLIFIDADKQNYLTYYQLVFDKWNKNGIIVADNVLWHGNVIEPAKTKDTKAIQAFNEAVQNDTRVLNTIIPIRDGIMMITKL